MKQTEYRLVSVGVSVGPAYFLQKHAKVPKQGSSMHERCERHPKRKKERKKERKKDRQTERKTDRKKERKKERK